MPGPPASGSEDVAPFIGLGIRRRCPAGRPLKLGHDIARQRFVAYDHGEWLPVSRGSYTVTPPVKAGITSRQSAGAAPRRRPGACPSPMRLRRVPNRDIVPRQLSDGPVPPRAGHRARRVSARLPLSSEYRTIDPTPHPLRRGRLSVHVMPPQRGPMRVACANLPEKPA